MIIADPDYRNADSLLLLIERAVRGEALPRVEPTPRLDRAGKHVLVDTANELRVGRAARVAIGLDLDLDVVGIDLVDLPDTVQAVLDAIGALDAQFKVAFAIYEVPELEPDDDDDEVDDDQDDDDDGDDDDDDDDGDVDDNDEGQDLDGDDDDEDLDIDEGDDEDDVDENDEDDEDLEEDVEDDPLASEKRVLVVRIERLLGHKIAR